LKKLSKIIYKNPLVGHWSSLLFTLQAAGILAIALLQPLQLFSLLFLLPVIGDIFVIIFIQWSIYNQFPE